MCLAVPAKVISLMADGMAKVSLDGAVEEISLAFVDDVAVGDYVVIHAGHALSRIDADEAEETLSMLREATLKGVALP